MLHIALYQPEIPPNTGNIIRLCANGAFTLHLIHPLGFTLDDKRMRRAGLDYDVLADVVQHQSYDKFSEDMKNKRIFACTTKSTLCYAEVKFADEDVLLFGPESRGLPDAILEATSEEQKITIPMDVNSRSLNLSNATAIIAYEAWRQLDFETL
jgi:tRNA (cytidine/uridine-2'-O-)-methyltransferase